MIVLPLPLVFLVACAPSADPPIVSDVTPAWGWTGEATSVVIAGQNFFPDIVVTADAADAGQVDGSFLAALVRGGQETALTGVQHLDYSTLTATVPGGIDPGAYDLRVTTPSGAKADLAGAFIVTTTRADHLDLAVQDAAYEVSELANVDIAVLDPGGVQVAQALVVEVRAASEIGAVGVRFEGTGLSDMTTTADGKGVQGGLAADGTARLLVTSDLPDDVTLSVTPVVDDGAGVDVIRGDTLLLSFDAGDLADVRLGLPNDPFVTTAGAPWDLDLTLLDKHGNVLTDTASRVLLTEDCGDWRVTVDVTGTATVGVATSTACPTNRIHALNQSIDVSSAEFQVSPGAMAKYLLVATPTGIEAGADAVLVLVTAADALGNVVSDHTGAVTLTDTAGGLDATLSRCPAFSGGLALCTVFLNHADPAVLISASDDLGRTGTSNPIRVSPGPVVGVDVLPLAASVVAGNALTILVTPQDAWGNAIAIEPGGADPVILSDDEGTLVCSWTGPSGAAQSFLCTFTAANPAATVSVSILSIGADGSATTSVAVANGPLALMDIALNSPPFTAGDPFALTLRGYDAWYNPYVVQADPAVTLGDSTGTLTPSGAALGPDGTVIIAAAITRTGSAVTVSASQAGTTLGESAPVLIGAAQPASYGVTAPPWIDLDLGGEIGISAFDGYGNPVVDYTGLVTVQSVLGLCEDATFSGFVGGVAVVSVACTEAGLADAWEAIGSDGLVGTSADVDVVDFACAAGPSAVLALDGAADVTACVVSGLATVTADASESDAGAVIYHFSESDGWAVRTLSDIEDLSWTTAGIREVTLIAVAGDGCADEDSGWAYIGESDGEAAGVVDVQVSDTTVTTLGTATVTVAALDCTGDVAGGETLLVRADLGVAAATATGNGLRVTLDSGGEATFDWSFPTGYIGDATILLGSESTGAFGSAEMAVTGDGARPHVVSVDPSGTMSGMVEAITVIFDEEMLASTISGATLTGPSGAIALTPSLFGDTLTLVPDADVDADAGAWTLSLAATFRDLAGNRLDGQWSGAPSAFASEFGAVADDAPILGACPPSSSRFLPDGDDGAGEEADGVSLTPTASGSPSWWWLTVADGAGARVRSARTAGTDATVEWDGRGDDGHIVATGAYALALFPMDSHSNVGDSCAVDVVVAQRVVTP